MWSCEKHLIWATQAHNSIYLRLIVNSFDFYLVRVLRFAIPTLTCQFSELMRVQNDACFGT